MDGARQRDLRDVGDVEAVFLPVDLDADDLPRGILGGDGLGRGSGSRWSL
jgi:hypothetical protein